MTRAIGYWHTGITVRDARRMADYFEQVLGFEVDPPVRLADTTAQAVTGVANADLQAIFLRGEGVTIELLEYGARDGDDAGSPPPNGIGGMHFAFMVDDLDAVLRAGEPWGRRVLADIFTAATGPRKGWRICYTTDDDGVLMELAQPGP